MSGVTIGDMMTMIWWMELENFWQRCPQEKEEDAQW